MTPRLPPDVEPCPDCDGFPCECDHLAPAKGILVGVLIVLIAAAGVMLVTWFVAELAKAAAVAAAPYAPFVGGVLG